MIHVLDREPVIGAAVSAGEESFHHLFGNQLQVANSGKALGIQIFVDHAVILGWGGWLEASGMPPATKPLLLVNDFEQFFDHVVSGYTVTLGSEAGGQAVSHNGISDIADIVE